MTWATATWIAVLASSPQPTRVAVAPLVSHGTSAEALQQLDAALADDHVVGGAEPDAVHRVQDGFRSQVGGLRVGASGT